MKWTWLLVLILGLALVLRTWQLGELPVILNRDEAALAYNALLLQQTGRDEWNRSWPLTLESFGDYKLPGYVWWLVGSFQVFGYADWVVRLPSVVAGVAIVGMSYLLGKRLGLSALWATLLALTVAVLPVFIFYSRMAFEANLGLWLMLMMIYLAYFSQWSQFKTAVGLGVLGLIAIFTYNTPFLLLPALIIPIPLIRDWRQPRSWWGLVASLVVVWLVGLMVLLPLNQQKSGITIFSDPALYPTYLEYRAQFTGLSQKLVGNRYVFWASLMGQRLMSSFSPSFLVTQGGTHPWHQVPGKAHLYWSAYGLALVGVATTVATIFRAWQFKRGWPVAPSLSLYLLGISVVPSIVTVDAPHATRSLFFFFMLAIMSIYGLQTLVTLLSRIKSQPVPALTKLMAIAFCVVILIEAAGYVHSYFWQYPFQQGAFKPGFDEQLQVLIDTTDQPTVIDLEGYHYILAAWYQRVPGEVFLNTVQRLPKDTIGFSYGSQVGDIRFVKSVASARELGVNQSLIWDDQSLNWQIIEIQ